MNWAASRYKIRSSIITIILIVSVSLAAAPALAADGPGTTGALYLRLPVSTRSIAMGEASAALPGDPFGWVTNPGARRHGRTMGIGLFHSQWALETYYDNASFEAPLGGMFTLHAGLTYLSAPEVQGYDLTGLPTQSLKNSDFQGIVGITVEPVEYLGIGMNVKYFQEVIADWTASGAAVDLGASARLVETGLSAGVSVLNIGQKVAFITHEAELPLTVRAGAAWRRTVVPGALSLTLAADAVAPIHEDIYPALGAEIEIRETFCLRAGFNGDPGLEDSGFSAGGGIRLAKRLLIDYAWTPYGDLGDFHRISVWFGLGD